MLLPPGVGSTQLSDALDTLGIAERVVRESLVSLGPPIAVIGVAYPMRVSAIRPGSGDRSAGLIEAIDAVPEGSVAVIEAAQERSAMLGELTYTAAARRGVQGFVCNGFVRDIEALRVGRVGVFARGSTPLRSYGRADVAEHGGEISFAGMRVIAGDLVVADSSGVVIVPQVAVKEVVERAATLCVAEEVIRATLKAGSSLRDAVRKIG